MRYKADLSIREVQRVRPYEAYDVLDTEAMPMRPEYPNGRPLATGMTKEDAELVVNCLNYVNSNGPDILMKSGS